MATKKETTKKVTKSSSKQGESKEVKIEKITTDGHGDYYTDVRVDCVCGNSFSINTTVPWPLKVETCYACHPAYNKNKVVKKVVKGRMEKFLERQKKIDAKR